MKTYSRFITEIKSHSHILDESALSILMSEQSITRVFNVTPESFKMAVIMTEDMKKENTDYFGYAFGVSASFLVALNIAALGHFTWTVGNRMFWHCEHIGPSGKIENVFINSKDVSFPAEKRSLTSSDARNSMILCATILRETDQTFRQEYLKGIIHLGAGFADLLFNREAFANFYRAFEYFITTRVLKKTKLGNEMKDLKEGIRLLGLPDIYFEEFKSLYKVRSEQVMHAQKEPRGMDMDDVLKIKVFTDYALHTYYRSQADQWLNEKKKAGILNE